MKKKKPTWMSSLWKSVSDALRAKPRYTPEEMKAYREAEDPQSTPQKLLRERVEDYERRELELVAAREAAARMAAMTPKSLGSAFGAALDAMKEGEVVARYYWGDGEPEYIFLVPGSHFLVNRPPLLGIFEKGDPIDYGDHIDALMEDHIAPWHPAYVDLLADDWYVLPKECREARNHKPTHQENRL